MTPYVRSAGERLLLDLHVVPGAAESEIDGLHGGRLKVRVAAPPYGGKANDEVVRFLADRLGLPRSAVELVHGASSRRKTVAVVGIREGEVVERLGDRSDRSVGP